MAILDFYRSNTIQALSGNWLKFDFGFVSDAVVVKNDSNALTLEGSHDGGTVHLRLDATESLGFDDKRRNSIYLRTSPGTASGCAYRLFSWRGAN